MYVAPCGNGNLSLLLIARGRGRYGSVMASARFVGVNFDCLSQFVFSRVMHDYGEHRWVYSHTVK